MIEHHHRHGPGLVIPISTFSPLNLLRSWGVWLHPFLNTLRCTLTDVSVDPSFALPTTLLEKESSYDPLTVAICLFLFQPLPANTLDYWLRWLPFWMPCPSWRVKSFSISFRRCSLRFWQRGAILSAGLATHGFVHLAAHFLRAHRVSFRSSFIWLILRRIAPLVERSPYALGLQRALSFTIESATFVLTLMKGLPKPPWGIMQQMSMLDRRLS